MKSVNIALDILQTAIRSIVEWLSNTIPWGGTPNALTVLLILLLGFSSISSIIRIFLFRKSHGLDLKAERRLQKKFEVMRESAPYVSRETYSNGIARRASVVFFLRSMFDSASKIVQPFGAYFLTTRGAYPTRIFTVGNIALSLAIMFIGWLSHDERKELVHRVIGIYSDVAQWVLSPKSIFGLLVVVFSLWIFAGRTPIIDHVRARSEASAKANSMLLRVSASVYDLYLKVAHRTLGFDAEMDRINDEVIREVSDGRYEWFGKEIRAASSYRGQNEVNDSAFGELASIFHG